jgi:prepilin-type N-terminal cleavage/methylation domain-containing protein
MKRTAFTLIEVLVAMSIGLALVAALWAAFSQVMQAARTNQAVTSLHLEASAIHFSLNQSLSSMFHGGQCRVEFVPKTGGNPDARCVLDFMSGERTWTRLEWRTGSNGHGPPKLSIATLAREEYDAAMPSGIKVPYVTAFQPVDQWLDEEPVVKSTGTKGFTVRLGTANRRDRRRELDDNDLRLLRNVPPAALPLTHWQGEAIGDGSRLQDALVPLSTHISRFRLELVDVRGYRTIVNCTPGSYDGTEPPIGISYRDHAGNVLTPPALSTASASPNVANVWTSTVRSLDGIWADGRNVPCNFYKDYDGGTLPAQALERPALIRIAFVLNQQLTFHPAPANTGDQDAIEFDRTRPGGNTYVSREFSFTFATSPINLGN